MEKPFDPGAMWREMLGQWEQAVNRYGGEAMRSEQFVQGMGGATAAAAQPIVTVNYRPPETVQPVAIPVDPKEHRLQVLIISGQNSYEHDWTGVNNLLRKQLQSTGRFDVRVTDGASGDSGVPRLTSRTPMRASGIAGWSTGRSIKLP